MQKPGAAIGLNQVPSAREIHTLLEELTADELERVAAAVIREHRDRLQKAQDLFGEVDRLEVAGVADHDIDRTQHDYRIAMLNLHAQHQLVSLVVSRLGYVPEVGGATDPEPAPNHSG